jgi:acetolactate synthase-1/2/3 large subunit
LEHPRSFLTTGVAGTLGACVAQAIGAQPATDRKVLGIVGDGGFLFSAAELASAVQHHIPLTIQLHDNGAYGNVKGIPEHRFGTDRVIASTLVNPDFVAFGQSFGIDSRRVHTPSELCAGLAEALAHAGPSLVVRSTGDICRARGRGS